MAFRVAYVREARADLVAIDRYIARESSASTAHRFIDAIVAKCESLKNFPYRGSPRDDIGKGLRTLAFQGRATIVYSIEEETVLIAGIVYKGQDVAKLLDR